MREEKPEKFYSQVKMFLWCFFDFLSVHVIECFM